MTGLAFLCLQWVPLLDRLAASASSLLLNVLAKSLDRGLAARPRRHRVGAHASGVSTGLGIVSSSKDLPVLDLLGHGQESLLDVGRVLGRSLQERNAELVGERLGRRVVDHLLRRQIRLVADQQLVDALDGITVNLLQPLLDVCECVAVGHIVDNNDTVRSWKK